MKKIILAAFLSLIAAPAFAGNVGVSVNIGQPGFYGHIDIGDYPQPQVIYEQPVIIQRTTVVRQPLYLRVPPGHEKHWDKHCRQYNACGQPVYFVRDDWYNDVYVPQYREHHGDRDDDRGHDDGGDHGGKGHGKGHDKHDKHGDD